MSTDERDPTLAAAERLEQSMSELATEVSGLHQYGQRNRRLIRTLAVSLVFDVILSVFLGVVAIQANTASNKASDATSVAAQNRVNARIACEVGNQSRAAQIQLWGYVISLASTRDKPPPTPQELARIKKFEAYVNVVFQARDCNDLTAVPSIPVTPPK